MDMVKKIIIAIVKLPARVFLANYKLYERLMWPEK
jgi:hypothetical protein